MLLNEFLCLLLFASLCGGLLLGYPVAFSLAGLSLFWGLVGYSVDVLDLSVFGAITSRIYGNAINSTILLAVPLFVFMGVMLERSKVAEELLDTMGTLFGPVRGGLSFSVTVVGALLAASTGIVGATVVTMGLLSLPTMLRRNYDKAFICGTICSAGTLGQIIPPSIVLVILGDQLSNSYVRAQRELGNFAPEPVSVGDLFAGALLPGFVLVGLYILYQAWVAFFHPEKAPAVPVSERPDFKTMLPRVIHALVPPLVLIVAVLGSILFGFAAPTESAGVGAVGALMLAAIRVKENKLPLLPAGNRLIAGFDWLIGRIDSGKSTLIYLGAAALILMIFVTNLFDIRMQREIVSSIEVAALVFVVSLAIFLIYVVAISVWRVFRHGVLNEVTRSATKVTVMVFGILIGAGMFSLVLRGLGGDEIIRDFLLGLPGGFATQMFIVMLVLFLLGFVIDFIEITLIVVPIVAPILLLADINPVWLGIMIALNLQTSFLTPPFGFSLFYLRGCAGKEIKTSDIYRGVLPFVALQVVAIGLLALFPQLATWLPKVIFG